MQSFMPIHCLLFEIQIIRKGFTGQIRYPVFQEMGPRSATVYKAHWTYPEQVSNCSKLCQNLTGLQNASLVLKPTGTFSDWFLKGPVYAEAQSGPIF